MASLDQADHLSTPCHLDGIPRMNCSPQPALNSPPISSFSNALASDFREKYTTEMHASYGGSYRNGPPGYQHPDVPQVWQLPGSTSDMHMLSLDSIIRGPCNGMMAGGEHGSELINRGSPGLLPSSSSELYGSTVVSGDWDQFVDSSARYSSLLSSSSSSPLPQASHSGPRGVNEGAMIRELIGRLGGNGMGSNCVSPIGGSLVSSPQRGGPGIDKPVKLGNAWNAAEVSSNVGLTVDPSKGGLALQGLGLRSPHCLAHFPSDPGFVERAARFSSFSNGNYSQPFPASDDGKTRSRSGASQSSENNNKQLSKTSCFPSSNENAGAKTPTDDPGVPKNEETTPDTGGADEAQDVRDGKFEIKEGEKILCRTASSLPTLDGEGATEECTPVDQVDAADVNPAQEMSSSDQVAVETSPSGVTSVTDAKEILTKKRKSSFDEKPKDTKTTDSDDGKAKRFKRGDIPKDKEDLKPKVERSSSETSGETSPRSMKELSKPSEPPKPDYIHVRARRGQATDSHSLAERVRREKISERMKFLQDLVPGCSKVTGKAVMLDEIINYVQSLQRQVEFLSMKLAAVNPRLDFNIESLLAKEVSHSRSSAMVLGPETIGPYRQIQTPRPPQLQHPLLCGLDYPVQPLANSHMALRRSISAPIHAAVHREDSFGGLCQTGWDDGELQSIVQMGFGHHHSLSQGLVHGHLPPGHMKIEL